MIRMTSLALIACLAAQVVVATPLAHAQGSADVETRARTYFENGRRLSAEGRYAEALAEFSGGYELSRRPLFLFNMGECARAMGETARAREYYERYLREDPSGDLAAQAKSRLAALPGGKPAAPPTPTPPKPSPTPTPTPVVVPTRAAPKPVPTTPAEPPAEPQARPDLVPPPPSDDIDDGGRPFWKRPGVWIGVGIGAALIGGAIILYATRDSGDPYDVDFTK